MHHFSLSFLLSIYPSKLTTTSTTKATFFGKPFAWQAYLTCVSRHKVPKGVHFDVINGCQQRRFGSSMQERGKVRRSFSKQSGLKSRPYGFLPAFWYISIRRYKGNVLQSREDGQNSPSVHMFLKVR